MKSLGRFPDPFLEEIVGQPAAIQRAADGLDAQLDDLSRVASPIATGIVFTGMGASFDACLAPVTVLAGRGVAAGLLDTAELLHFGLPILRPGGVLVAVSQSGESAEVVRLVEALEQPRPLLVSVTNGLENTLARAADVALDTRAGFEAGPSTLTFASAIVVLAALAEVLGGRAAAEAVARVRAAAEDAASAATFLLAFPERLADALERWHADRAMTVILGRGTARAAAACGALILKEAARLPAEALESAQFRHGPLELAGPDLAVAIVAAEPGAAALEEGLGAELVDAGASVLMVGPTAEAASGMERVELQPVDRALAPAVAVIPLQLLARRLSVKRGLTPGRLTIARKVTVRE